MSLKGFHIIFILCAVTLLAGFGVWGLRVAAPGAGVSYRLLGGLSLAGAAGLAAYGVWFLRKLRNVSSL